MNNRQIIEAVQRMTKTQLSDNVKILSATVDSVSESKRTCVVTSVSSQGSVTIENVQLMASIDDGILLVPSIDSTVIIAYSTFNQPFIALFSGIEKVLLVAGENNASIQVDTEGLLLEIAQTKVLISDGEIKLNDGAMGGLVKVIQLTQKLNNLENKVNQLITAYNSHVHTGVTTGPGSSATTPTQVTGSLTPTQRADIENEKIVHG
ncbi:MAG: hypothetical protein IM569_13555 [Chitinophagaceae bacterium]|nr:hypothetical protein [Chitinophagaceae bacterium]MCA6513875.1 hypothetical protein [Chitinophagaceae bacterium]